MKNFTQEKLKNTIKRLAYLLYFMLIIHTDSIAQFSCGFQPGEGCSNTDYSNAFMNSNNNAATIEYDNFVSAFHSTSVRNGDGTFKVWGKNMANDGTSNALEPLVINGTNYPALGSNKVYKLTGGSQEQFSVQYVALAADGLYAWGTEGQIIDNSITSSSTFQKVTIGGQSNGLPAGVTPADVKVMTASSNSLLIVTCDGFVWVLSSVAQARGNGSTGSYATWAQVTTSEASNPALGGIIAARIGKGVGFALKSDGTLWTWGIATYLGDNTTPNNTRNRATQMTAPTGTIKMIQLQVRETRAGFEPNIVSTYFPAYYVLMTDGNLYALGENSNKELGDWTTTDRLSWVQPRYDSATGPVMDNIKWVSASDNDVTYNAVNVLTNDATLYAFGNSNANMIGRGTGTSTDPGIPTGISATDKIIAVETGGHTTMIIKQCVKNFGYVGHRIDGSMGNGSAANITEPSYTFATPEIDVCAASQVDVYLSPDIFGPTNQYCIGYEYDVVGQPAGGTLTQISGDATITGDPTAGYKITFTSTTPTVLQYSVTGACVTESLEKSFSAEICNITINTTVAEDDINQTPKDVPVSGNVLTNDTDAEGNTQTVTSVTADTDGDGQVDDIIAVNGAPVTIYGTDDTGNTVPAGTLVINADGSYTFDPNATFTGTVPVQYVTSDNLGATDPAKLNIEVIGENATGKYPVIAQDDNATTTPNTPVDIQILANDDDVDGTLINSTIDLDPSTPGVQTTFTVAGEGVYTLNPATGVVTFAPETGYTGDPTPINYQVCDNDGLCDAAVIDVYITSNPANEMTAEDDGNSGFAGSTLTGGVLGNDIDPDGSSATPTVTAALADTDGDGISDDVLTIGTSTPVFGKDATGASVPAGSLTLNADGTYTYVSNPTFVGTVVVSYTANDNDGTAPATDKASLYLSTVLPANTTVAEDDINQTPKDVPVSGNVLTNDTDAEGNTKTVTSVTVDSDGDGQVDDIIAVNGAPVTIYGTDDAGNSVPAGTLVINADGTYTFDPNATFTGTVPVQYVTSDNLGATDPAKLNIEVIGENATGKFPVIAQDDNATTTPNTPVNIQILANDDDIDGTLVNGTIDLDPSTPGVQTTFTVAGEGVYTLNPATGVVTFAPETGYTGDPTPINYQVCDNDGLCDAAVIDVYITSNPANEMTAEDNANSGFAGSTLTGGVLGNDIDPDGSSGTPTVTAALADTDGDGIADDVLTIGSSTPVFGKDATGASVPAGSLTLNADGTYTYISNPTFVGTVVVSYTANDNDGTAPASDKASLYLSTVPTCDLEIGGTVYLGDLITDGVGGTPIDGNIFDLYVTLWEGTTKKGVEKIGGNGTYIFTGVTPGTYKLVIGTIASGSSISAPVASFTPVGEGGELILGVSQGDGNPNGETTITVDCSSIIPEKAKVAATISYLNNDFEIKDVTPLPISLLGFSGLQIENQINLTWKTANEKDFSHFEVQKSADAKEFGTITKVQGSKANTYNAIDSKPIEGTNYYRLKMVDLDGSSKLSNIIQVKYEKDNSYMAVENPAKNGVFKVKTNLKNPRFTLFTTSGAKADMTIIETGNNIYTIKSKNAAGIYYLNIEANGTFQTRKVLMP